MALGISPIGIGLKGIGLGGLGVGMGGSPGSTQPTPSVNAGMDPHLLQMAQALGLYQGNGDLSSYYAAPYNPLDMLGSRQGQGLMPSGGINLDDPASFLGNHWAEDTGIHIPGVRDPSGMLAAINAKGGIETPTQRALSQFYDVSQPTQEATRGFRMPGNPEQGASSGPQYTLKSEYQKPIDQEREAAIKAGLLQVGRNGSLRNTGQSFYSDPYASVLRDPSGTAYIPGIGNVTKASNIPDEYLPQMAPDPLAGMLASAALSLMLGPAGAGILGSSGAGAAGGALGSAVTGGNPIMGAITGGLAPQIGNATNSLFGSSLSGLSPLEQSAIRSGTSGALSAALYGGDPLSGALTGGLTGGLGQTLTSSGVPQALASPLASVGAGMLTGQSPSPGALAMNMLKNIGKSSTPNPSLALNTVPTNPYALTGP